MMEPPIEEETHAAPPRPVVLVDGARRWLGRFTARCPSTPSCGAYAVAVVRRFGARRGLQLAAARLRRCGRTHRTGNAPDPYG